MLRRSEKIGWWVAAACILIQGCPQQKPQKQFVARVDQALLTEEDLAASNDTLGRVPQNKREYITEWVNSELLYQEAKRRGLTDNDQFRRQLEATTRKLIINELLEQELYGEENVSEDEIVALYNGGGEFFRLREDVVSLSYALFSDRDAANAFRGKLVRGIAWNTAIEEVRKDSLLQPHLLQAARRRYFSQGNLYPVELWRLARNLAKDEVSFAVKTDPGYYILVAHNMKRQGEIPELDYIRNEIRDRILIERRRLKYEKLLAELHRKYPVEVHLTETDTSTKSE